METGKHSIYLDNREGLPTKSITIYSNAIMMAISWYCHSHRSRLKHSKHNPAFGSNTPNDATTNTSVQKEFDEIVVLLRLSSVFWIDLVNIYNSDVISSAKISVDSSFNGKVLDLDSVSASNYKELRDEINDVLDLKFISENPLYSAEFTSHINGNAIFRNTASGAEISLALTDTDDSGWPSGGSGLGAVEVETDEYGNHIQTEIEFGVNEWNAEQFLSSANQAFEYNNSAPPSSIENLGSASTQRWDLDSIDIWSNGVPNGLPSSNIQDLFNKALENQEISFYTSFSGYQDGEAYFTPGLEVSDYVDNIVDFQTGESGFDLQLIGPNQSNVLLNHQPITIAPIYTIKPFTLTLLFRSQS